MRYRPELAPAHLALACLQQGCRPPGDAAAFPGGARAATGSSRAPSEMHYFAVGYDVAFTALILAATNPGGRFWYVELDTAARMDALLLADRAGIDNLLTVGPPDTTNPGEYGRFAVCSVIDEIDADLPDLDIICLHDVWSRLDVEGRAAILNLVRSRLKPGGILYLDYDCAVGWEWWRTGAYLLRETLNQESRAPQNLGADRDRAIRRSLDVLAALLEQRCGFFRDAPARDWLESLRQNPELVEHYLCERTSCSFSEVESDLSSARLTFLGSADLLANYDRIHHHPKSRELAERLENRTLTETLKDFDHNTSHRRDLFVRGARMLAPDHTLELIEAQRFSLPPVCSNRPGETAPILQSSSSVRGNSLVARTSRRRAGKEPGSKSPEAWQSHVEDDFGSGDAASADASEFAAEGVLPNAARALPAGDGGRGTAPGPYSALHQVVLQALSEGPQNIAELTAEIGPLGYNIHNVLTACIHLTASGEVTPLTAGQQSATARTDGAMGAGGDDVLRDLLQMVDELPMSGTNRPEGPIEE